MTERQRIEKELLRAVEERKIELQSAPPETRRSAQQKFLKALQLFSAFLLNDKLPDIQNSEDPDS